MRNNIILTGRPGIGKSTVVREVVKELGVERAGGFWSGEIREQNRRVGFQITTISGRTGILAHVDIERGPRVSKYTVNLKDIEEIAIPALIEARVSERIIVIDEIASMELKSPRFAPEVRRCLETRRVFATLQERRSPFQDEIRAREDIIMLELTQSNRERMHEKVLSILRDEHLT
ncbi:MAG: NTPase [Candidatus Thorarchaeota archaeon]